PTPNQTFEQVNARLTYQATAKLGLYASACAEFRQFDGNRSTYTTPVFEVGLTHHPFEGTTINLAAGRSIYNSGFLGAQDFANTYVVGRFQQRLFRRFYLGLGGGYENSNYFAAADNISAPRNDDYWFIEPSLDVLITRWLSAGGLRFRSERLRRRRSFRRRRFAHKRTIESRGQFKCAIAGLSPFSGFNADAGSFETYGVVRSRLSGEPQGKRDAAWLREAAVRDPGAGPSAGP